VCAGVQQVLALEIYLRSAELLRHALGKIERGGAAAVVVQQIVQLGMEGRIGVGQRIGLLQLFERRRRRSGRRALSPQNSLAIPNLHSRSLVLSSAQRNRTN
jgi:hypothetical protein